MNETLDVSAVLSNLQSIAMKDGVITEEEQKLISVVISNLSAYTSILEKAVEDGIITPEEKNSMFEQRMEVLEGAYATARDDLEISDDEAALLKEVCDIVMKLNDK